MNTKFCSHCNIEKDISEFYIWDSKIFSWCKKCFSEYNRQRYADHKEQRKEYRKSYYEQNRDSLNQKASKKRAGRKAEIMTHYSGGTPKCARCGEDDLIVLCLDHINGGGRKHRQEVCNKGVYFYNWVYNNGFPDGFQVLCCNCNQRKKAENREYFKCQTT